MPLTTRGRPSYSDPQAEVQLSVLAGGKFGSVFSQAALKLMHKLDGGTRKIPHVVMIASMAKYRRSGNKEQKLRETCITRADMLIVHLPHTMSR
jgi:hypothetical protein